VGELGDSGRRTIGTRHRRPAHLLPHQARSWNQHRCAPDAAPLGLGGQSAESVWLIGLAVMQRCIAGRLLLGGWR